MNLSGSTLSFPIRTDVRGTIAISAERSETIAQAIADVLETRQGERVMMPDYGIPDLVFSVQDASFAARLAYHLEEQVIRYVSLVATVNVKVETDSEGRAVANVRYTEVGRVNAPRNLVFPVWRLRGDV